MPPIGGLYLLQQPFFLGGLQGKAGLLVVLKDCIEKWRLKELHGNSRNESSSFAPVRLLHLN